MTLSLKRLPIERVAAALAAILAALLLASCGGDEEAEGGDTITTGTVTFKPDPLGNLGYAPSEVSVAAGKTKVVFDNPQSQVHDLTIEDAKDKRVGQTYLLIESNDSIVVNLKPGEYSFFCSVRGHRKGGMEGTLTVE